MKGLLGLDLHLYIKGNLSGNRTERDLHDCLRDLDYSTIIREMIDITQDSRWTKEGWACFECLSSFFEDMLPAWWLERKRKAGKTIMKDCRHGYDCKKQMWEQGFRHASQFNHLCKPIQPNTGTSIEL